VNRNITLQRFEKMAPQTMNAVRFHGQHDLRYEQIPVPELKAGQVKLRPSWVGICGSDLHELQGGANLCPTTPHPITGETVPLTFGHEFSGVVEEVGEGVTDYKPGDRVVVQVSHLQQPPGHVADIS
jgi:threonine dehydrogenase-like Zn-dependent dehydrogenase